MTIYKYILRDGKLKVTEMEAVSLPDGYSVKRGPVRFFIERDEIGKAVGNNLKHVYLLKRDDALAASAFMRYKQRNLEELKEIADDPGEIIGGQCLDCMEQERRMQAKAEHAFKVMTSPFYQMDLMEVLNESK